MRRPVNHDENTGPKMIIASPTVTAIRHFTEAIRPKYVDQVLWGIDSTCGCASGPPGSAGGATRSGAEEFRLTSRQIKTVPYPPLGISMRMGSVFPTVS